MMDYELITKVLREYIQDNTVKNGNCWWQPEDTNAVIAFCDNIDAIHRSLEEENESLREREQTLITLLYNDCDIDVSWDGLRKFWNIGLTENGCLMRDRACKAEAENEQLRNASERGDDWPLDADGVAWNIGDLDENGYEVTSLKLTKSGWFYFADGMPNDAGEHRHYHPDTWESIIEDALGSRWAAPDELSQDFIALVARCKALCERTREGEE